MFAVYTNPQRVVNPVALLLRLRLAGVRPAAVVAPAVRRAVDALAVVDPLLADLRPALLVVGVAPVGHVHSKP